MTDPLLQFRERFPILSKTKYLVSHSLGAMPDATRDALVEYADLWASRGVRAWGDRWWMMSIEVAGSERVRSAQTTSSRLDTSISSSTTMV